MAHASPESKAMIVRGPWVRTPTIAKTRLREGLERVYQLPYYSSVERILEQEEQRTCRLLSAGHEVELEEENEVLD